MITMIEIVIMTIGLTVLTVASFAIIDAFEVEEIIKKKIRKLFGKS